VKLLIDHNLSPTLVVHLKDRYPGSVHTMELGFERKPDHDLWSYARDNGFTILTKDTDFEQLSLLRGAPPKVVWLRIGNSATREVLDLLHKHHRDIEEFEQDGERSLLALWPK
jgi:predicted nuclease of predicted toxin-antitoxin system